MKSTIQSSQQQSENEQYVHSDVQSAFPHLEAMLEEWTTS